MRTGKAKCHFPTYSIPEGCVPLAIMQKGQRGIIADLATTDIGKLHKLMALGVMPGMPVQMVQSFPSYVFRVGHTQIAVDRDLAGSIRVKPQ